MDKLKLYLGITDDSEDELLETILLDCEQMLRMYIGAKRVPMELEWIITELSVKRYRKIGSEGLKEEQIDVITNTFEDGEPLAPYHSILNDYKRKSNRLRML